MEEKKTIFSFLGNVFCVFGISMALLMVFCRLFGGMAGEISSMFRLGKEGIPVDIMAQFLTVSFIITGIQYLIFSEKLLRRWSVLARTMTMILIVVAVLSVFICLFGWFPLGMWEPWVRFLTCFLICFGVSTLLMRLKTRLENRKLEEGLARMREKWEEEADEQRRS